MIRSMEELEAVPQDDTPQGRHAAGMIATFGARHAHGLKCPRRDVNTCRRCRADYRAVFAAVTDAKNVGLEVSMSWALKASAYIIN